MFMAAGAAAASLAGLADVPFGHVEITIASGTVASDLTGFPVLVRLSDMPPEFWDAVKNDGGDIRVTDDADVLIPHDLVAFDIDAEEGLLFFRADLLAASDNTFKITAGDSGLSELDPTDPNGRDAVWADYHRVFVPTENVDRTGSGQVLTLNTIPQWGPYKKGPDEGSHQGVAWDGTHYYVSDTNRLRKYDASWATVATNADPIADSGLSVNHCGDLEVVGSLLYVPMENYPAVTGMRIGVFDKSDLSFTTSYDISAQGHEVSSIAYNPDDGLLYVASFEDPSQLWKYNLAGVFQGTLSLTGHSYEEIQGLTFFEGKIYTSNDDDKDIHEHSLDGAHIRSVWDSGMFATVVAPEGLGHNDDGLLHLIDNTSIDGVYEIRPRDRVSDLNHEWLPLNGQTSNARLSVSKLTNWTLGISAIWAATFGHNNGLVGYGVAGSGDNANRANIVRRDTNNDWGLWNSTDSWLDSGIDPVAGASTRLVYLHEGTTRRTLFINGAQAANDNGVAQRPASAGDGIFIGFEDTTGDEAFGGFVTLFYLRNGLLTANWLAAEYESWHTPSSFYAVGYVPP